MSSQPASFFRSLLRLPASAALLITAGVLALAPSAARAQAQATLTTVHNFTPPNASSTVIQAANGNYYGVTAGGGGYGFGSVYRVTSGGTYSTIFSFHGSDGDSPLGSLVQGTDGNLYGTTFDGGNNSTGTVFKITTIGVLTTLYHFSAADGDHKNTDGANSRAALVQGTDGNLYGTTYYGGINGSGTIFCISTTGSLTTLYSFKQKDAFDGSNKDGFHPAAALLQAADGNFYGTTQEGGDNDHGTAFRITSGGAFTTLYKFSPNSITALDGAGPASALVQGTDSNFYGVLETGGTSNGPNGPGTVFRLSSSGTFTKLHTFAGTEGSTPKGPLVLGNDGFLYGATQGGSGTIFRVSTGGNLTTLHTFATAEGTNPPAGLTLGTDGNFYGVTKLGGDDFNGTVFQYAASTDTLTVLQDFGNIAGGQPTTALIVAQDGNLYGTTPGGGDYNYGTVYRITPTGIRTTIYSFNPSTGEGIVPQTALLQAGDGTIYGTTSQGGLNGGGTIFTITSAGVLNTIHNLDGGSEGASPQGALIQGTDGNLYGTTANGGANGNGIVFKLTTGGQLTRLYSFTGGNDGGNPQCALVQSDDGTFFYGTTYNGGVNGRGTAFRITSGATFTSLHSFNSNEGQNPASGFIKGMNGFLYGTTVNGGANGAGTVYRMSTAGSVSLVYSFSGSGSDGAFPYASLLVGDDGNYYGTTYNGGVNAGGVIYRVTPGTGAVATLYNLNDGNNGYYPQGGLVQGADGTFYGTTIHSRINLDGGTIYRFTLAPVVNSASSASGTIGSPFSFTVTGTNAPTTFAASGLPDGLSINTGTGVISGTPTEIGTFGVSLTISNSFGTGFGNLAILIKDIVPEITSDLNPPSRAGNAFSYQIVATHNPTSYAAEGLPPGLTLNTVTGKITGTPTQAGDYAVNISATNSGGTASAVLTITVKEAIPVISSSLSVTGQVGVTFSYQIAASHNPTSFGAASIPPGLSVNQTTGKIEGVPTKAGTYSMTIAASNTGGTGSATVSVLIKPVVPVISGDLNPPARLGTAFSYQITATGNPTSYAASGLPAGLSVDTGTGKITGTPTAYGTFSVSISATNISGTGTATLNLVVKQQPPVITSALSATGQVGVAFSYQATTTNAPATFGTKGLPGGLGTSASTGKIVGTPTTAGTYNVSLTVTNTGGTDTEILTITIKPVAPEITSASSAPARQGVVFSYQITATNKPTSYGASGLPGGLTINQTTGRISGTPTVFGTFNVTIKATNSGGSDTAALSVVVKQAIPVITSNLNPPSRQGVAFSYQITATNAPTSYGAASLPPGLTLNQTTGRISGIPTKAGTYTATVAAFNSGGSGSAKVTIVVKPPA